jgi:hypothetical protein
MEILGKSVNVTSKKELSRRGPMDICLDIISKKMADSRMIWEKGRNTSRV